MSNSPILAAAQFVAAAHPIAAAAAQFVSAGAHDIHLIPAVFPTAQFTASSATVNQNAGTFSVTVTLSFASGSSATVPFTLGGTAVQLTDYTVSTGNPLTFSAGTTSKTITGNLVDDGFGLANRTIIFTLGSPTGATLGSTTSETLTIHDSDPEPSVQFAAGNETDTIASSPFALVIDLSAASAVTTTIPFILGGSAVLGTDFSGVTSSPLTIPASETSVDITGNLLSHSGHSTDIFFTLGTPTNATLGTTGSNQLNINQQPVATSLSLTTGGILVSSQLLSVTVTAKDQFGNTFSNYAGTIHFTSSDTDASLPPDYTFTPSDAGVHTFNVTLNTTGTESVNATDTLTNSIAGHGNFTVLQAQTHTALTASANPSVVGQTVTFTATVSSNSPAIATPSGSVAFMLNGSMTGSPVALSGGVATLTFTLTSLSQTGGVFSAAYLASSDFAGSTSSTLTQTVNRDFTTTALSSSANPSAVGQSVTFIATVSAASPGAGTPAGTVTFLDGFTPLGSGSLFNGIATFSTVGLSDTSHSITAFYAGDGNFNSGSSHPLTQTVDLFFPVSFVPQASVTVGNQPSSIAVGDFNGDGQPDMAVVTYSNSGPYTLSILLGNANGTFMPPTSVIVPYRPTSVAVDDFNGDGRADLAVGSPNGVTILFGNGNGAFGAPHTFPAGSFNGAVTAADFNGDGILDLAVPNFLSSTVSVLLGNANGTFKSPITIPDGTGYLPASIATGDFNGDGKLDMAVANQGDATVSIFLGNGDGTFAAPIIVPVGSNPDSIAAGDFNGDGKLDLAVVNSLDNTLSILLGNGNGTFAPQTTLAVGNTPSKVVAADFNGDGKLDLAVTDQASNSESILLGNGNGTFQPQVSLAVGAAPISAAVGDFNGDGKPDLLVLDQFANSVSVLLNTAYGTGGRTFTSLPTVAVGNFPVGVAVGDFNGDGKLDLAITNLMANSVSILTGGGNGTFTLSDTLAVGDYPNSVAVGDFNGDGHLDLAVTNGMSATVSILLGNGNGTFKPQTTVAAGSYPKSVVVGDFNGDGKPDLAVADQNGGDVSILLGNGDGNFKAATTFAVGTSPRALVAGDFTNDGKLDLAVANQGSNNVSILLGNGNGMFQTQRTYNVGAYPSSIAAGEFNGDGKLDLAVGDQNSGAVSILLGNGNGSFKPQTFVPVGSVPTSVSVGDFNGDGKLDLAVTNFDNNSESILLGNGNGTFGSPSTEAVGMSPIASAVGDLNGDGKPDLVVVDRDANEVSVLLNAGYGSGGGAFAPQTTFPSGQGPYGVAVGDFNHDDNLDLAVADSTTNSVSILLGNSNGTFQAPITVGVGADPLAVAVGDFNGDGKLDLAVSNARAYTVSILLGNGDGTFKMQSNFAVGHYPIALAIGDFNGDGKPDVAVLNRNDDDVSILLNTTPPGASTPSFAPQLTATVGDTPQSIAVGDFFGDGETDLAVSNLLDGTISILRPNSNGTFKPQITIPAGRTPRSIALGGFNHDGNTDIAVADINSIGILLGNGNGTFKPITSIATSADLYSITAADLNGDGNLDLAALNQNSGAASVFLGNGDGTFGSPSSLPTGMPPVALVVGDFNHDGKPDLVATNYSGNNVSVLLNHSVAPSITSSSGATFIIGTSGAATISTTGTPTPPSISAIGALPAGLIITNNGNGTATLSGTPAAGTAGTYLLALTAADGALTAALQTFTLTVDQAPAITSANSATFTTGAAASFVVTATGFPTASITESGALPGGITFLDSGNGSATLSGTPAAGASGVFVLHFTAADGTPPNASQAFALTVDQAPAITSTGAATFTTSTAGAFNVTTTGFPNPTLSETGALPSGVTFIDNGNGTATFSGTPAAGTGAAYVLSITAADGVSPNATQAFTLNVDQPPSITSAGAVTFTAGTAASFMLTTTGFPFPTSTETGALPAGVTFVDNGNGTATLSESPGSPGPGGGGVFVLNITSANGLSPSATQAFTLTADQSPIITSPSTATFTTGAAGTFTVTTSAFPTAKTGVNTALPSGLTFTKNGDGTSTLAGTPATGTGGTYVLALVAKSPTKPNGRQSLTLTIDQASAITSANNTTFSVGDTGKFIVKTTGFPIAKITESGALPAGVTFVDKDNGKARLHGAPAPGTEGTYTFTIKAKNVAKPRAKESFTLVVDPALSNASPAIASPQTPAPVPVPVPVPVLTSINAPTPDSIILSAAGQDTLFSV